jgi:hypothetical protein
MKREGEREGGREIKRMTEGERERGEREREKGGREIERERGWGGERERAVNVFMVGALEVP